MTHSMTKRYFFTIQKLYLPQNYTRKQTLQNNNLLQLLLTNKAWKVVSKISLNILPQYTQSFNSAAICFNLPTQLSRKQNQSFSLQNEVLVTMFRISSRDCRQYLLGKCMLFCFQFTCIVLTTTTQCNAQVLWWQLCHETSLIICHSIVQQWLFATKTYKEWYNNYISTKISMQLTIKQGLQVISLGKMYAVEFLICIHSTNYNYLVQCLSTMVATLS
eukprot:TRINITY_DN7554_c1_g1_i1.p1 TRINITY_DN7554_c1_g1~~TRINITY_DN7554_c1_g1_i1.p1  ORF type:complete len:218 (+),score=-21.96 TRINITY_DN7554_c1_g1_i1:336-989(+)